MFQCQQFNVSISSIRHSCVIIQKSSINCRRFSLQNNKQNNQVQQLKPKMSIQLNVTDNRQTTMKENSTQQNEDTNILFPPNTIYNQTQFHPLLFHNMSPEPYPPTRAPLHVFPPPLPTDQSLQIPQNNPYYPRTQSYFTNTNNDGQSPAYPPTGSYSDNEDILMATNTFKENAGNIQSIDDIPMAFQEDSISDEDNSIKCEECDLLPPQREFQQVCSDCLWEQDKSSVCSYCFLEQRCVKCESGILQKMKYIPELDMGNDIDLIHDIAAEYRDIAQQYIDRQQKIALVGAQIGSSLRAHQVPDSLVIVVISFLY